MEVGEEMVIISWIIDVSMIFQGLIWICGTWLPAPVNVLAFQRSCFGVWYVEDSDLHAILVGFNPEVNRCC